jgi:hypothetical protein
MNFGAFQRSQGKVQQNVKPRVPRSTSDHMDHVGRSPCQVGPTGRPASPLHGQPAPLCIQPGHVLHGISISWQERIRGNAVGSPPRSDQPAPL